MWILDIIICPFLYLYYALTVGWINPYTWYWKIYRHRLEPWTFEWRRYVAEWWGVVLIKMGLCAGVVLWLLLFPLKNASTGVRIGVLVTGIVIIVFCAWLLLHLGGFALWLIRKLRALL